MKCILVVLILVVLVLVFVIRVVLVIVLVILGDFCCRLEDVIVAVGGVVRLSPRRLLQALAEAVLVRVVLVGISVTHLGQQKQHVPGPQKQ